MKKLIYLCLLFGLSCFAVGCEQATVEKEAAPTQEQIQENEMVGAVPSEGAAAPDATQPAP